MGAKKEAASTRQGPLEGRCANHFEVAFTEFEFLISMGQSYQKSRPPIVHTRIIMTPHAAETLVNMLTEMLAEYKQTVGPISERSG